MLQLNNNAARQFILKTNSERLKMNKLLYISLAEQMKFREGAAVEMIRNAGSIEALFNSMASVQLEDNMSLAEGILETCLQKDINIITIEDPRYPEALRRLSDPPLVLYYRGVWRDLSKGLSIAMVGQRKATATGKMNAERFARDLTLNGVNIISGLAAGIDGASHRGAIKAGGFTVGVLGTGVDVYYPVENAGLIRTMAKEHLVISEFAPGTGGKPQNFPKRNRIVAALAKGTFVVEAQVKSGSLITARLAREMGRDVFALVDHSEGCQSLIAKGQAVAVRNAEDIINYYMPKGDKEQIKTPPKSEKPLTEEEIEILRLIALGKQKEEISEIMGLDISKVTRRVNMLEIKGYIVKTGHSKYEISERAIK